MTAPAAPAGRPALQLTPQNAAMLAIAALAWAGVITYALDMGNGAGTMGLSFAEFLPMWALMMVAMMLPAVAPVASLYQRTITSDRGWRLALFVGSDCPPCRERARQLQASGSAFDLYLVDSQNDDQLLRDWARQAGIEPARVQRRQITLNHDHGLWQRLSQDAQLPASFQLREGRWQRLE